MSQMPPSGIEKRKQGRHSRRKGREMAGFGDTVARGPIGVDNAHPADLADRGAGWWLLAAG